MAGLRVVAIMSFVGLSLRQAAATEPVTAESIMAKVAANQDRSEKLRDRYIYEQHIHVVSRKTNGKVLREETADYRVVPKPDRTEKALQHFTGRYWHGGKYVDFEGEPAPAAESTDRELVHSFREDLTDDHSKDGVARDLFPLTTDQQKDYQFRLMEEETFEGQKTYHVGFTPKNTEDIDWAGEAFIDEKGVPADLCFHQAVATHPVRGSHHAGDGSVGHRFCRPLSKAGGWRLVSDQPGKRIPHSRSLPFQPYHVNFHGEHSFRAYSRGKQDRRPRSVTLVAVFRRTEHSAQAWGMM